MCPVRQYIYYDLQKVVMQYCVVNDKIIMYKYNTV